jgi:hypothetical protein
VRNQYPLPLIAQLILDLSGAWIFSKLDVWQGYNNVLIVTVSPSPQSKDEENEKLHELRRYARDFRRQHTTDAERFDWDSDDGDYGLAIGRLVVT